MDEKEFVRKVRNSLDEGMSHSQIRNKLQSKKYKMEYIDSLIKRAEMPKKILTYSIIFLMVVYTLIAAYSLLMENQKYYLENPITGNAVKSAQIQNKAENLEITSEFLTYILNEAGAYKLHKSFLNFEQPIINLNISGKEYYSVISRKIETFEGNSPKADLIITTDSEEIIKGLQSENQKEYLINSIKNGKTRVNVLANELELISKGYFSLYTTLMSNSFSISYPK